MFHIVLGPGPKNIDLQPATRKLLGVITAVCLLRESFDLRQWLLVELGQRMRHDHHSFLAARWSVSGP